MYTEKESLCCYIEERKFEILLVIRMGRTMGSKLVPTTPTSMSLRSLRYWGLIWWPLAYMLRYNKPNLLVGWLRCSAALVGFCTKWSSSLGCFGWYAMADLCGLLIWLAVWFLNGTRLFGGEPVSGGSPDSYMASSLGIEFGWSFILFSPVEGLTWGRFFVDSLCRLRRAVSFRIEWMSLVLLEWSRLLP